MTTQPNWALVANLGDVSPLEYGGYFVYVDTTGNYPPEAALLDLLDEDDEESGYTMHRFVLEKCTFTNGVLSDNRFHPEHPAWFADSIDNIAICNGVDKQVLITALCSSDPIALAEAYRSIGMCHGFSNLDSYPLELSRAEAIERYPQFA